MNSFSFCLSGNVLLFPSLLKDKFARHRILDSVFFSFSIFEILSHSLLISMLSTVKLDVNLTEYPCTMRVRSVTLSWSCLSFNSLLMMSFLGFTELLGGIDSCLSSNLGNCQLLFLHIFFLPVSPLLWGLPIWMLVGLMGTHRSLRVCSLFLHPFFFLLFRLDNFSWPVFKFTDSSAHLNTLMKHSSEFFSSAIILSSSKIFV